MIRKPYSKRLGGNRPGRNVALIFRDSRKSIKECMEWAKERNMTYSTFMNEIYEWGLSFFAELEQLGLEAEQKEKELKLKEKEGTKR
jgi:hypothetical protein